MPRCARIAVLALALSAPLPCLADSDPPVTTVKQVDLQRYLGKWYEIARLPRFFQRQCVSDTTAEYSLRDDGRVDVVNACLKRNGDVSDAHGIAEPLEGSHNSKLKVTFLPPFSGDYWIIALDENYKWSVVGAPDRKSLWILARTPVLTDADKQAALAVVRAQRFKVKDLVYTPHTQGKAPVTAR